MLPRHARCVLSRLRYNGHSLLLSSYLSRIGRIENPLCSACEHPSKDTSCLILCCPVTDFLHRSLFGDSLSFYDLWSRLWGVSRLLGLHGLPPGPIPWKGSGAPTTFCPHRKMDKTYLPSFSSSEITYAEAVEFLRFCFHSERTASIASTSLILIQANDSTNAILNANNTWDLGH